MSIGKKYKMSTGKFIKHFTKPKEHVEDYMRENKSYFCSELIATW